MNYSLTGVRKIGAYKQKIAVTIMGSGLSGYVLPQLKGWGVRLTSLDAQDRDTGTTKYTAYVESPSDNTTNTGDLGDAIITVVYTGDTVPKTTTFTVKDTVRDSSSNNDIATVVNREYYRLTQHYVTDVNCYLTSALISLHSDNSSE